MSTSNILSPETYDLAIQTAITAGGIIMEIYENHDYEVTHKDDQSPLTLADRAAHEIITGALKRTGLPVLSEEGKSIAFEERKNWQKFWLVDPLDGTKEFIKKNGDFTVNIALIEQGRPVFGVVYAPALEELYVGIAEEGSWMMEYPKTRITLEKIKEIGVSLPNIPPDDDRFYKVVASRSHMNEETNNYIRKLVSAFGSVNVVSRGSSLKLCMVAKGEADEYPRLGPTMEWDVAAAHAVILGAGKTITIFGTTTPLSYNKENLLNPHFLVK